MNKSYGVFVLGLYKAILEDCRVRYPHLQKDFMRDYSRLSSCMLTRGLPFFMIDLVDYGKHFDLCLSNQRLIRSSISHQRPYKKGTPIPRLFKGLVSLVFLPNGMLRSDCDHYAILCLRQLYFTVKKLRLECSDERKSDVVRSFYRIERDIDRGSDEWSSDDPDWSYLKRVHIGQVKETTRGSVLPLFSFQEKEEVENVSPVDAMLMQTVQQVADIISSTLGVFNPYDWKVKHGPGAVSDAKFGVSKYSFPHWPKKLDRVFPFADFAFANYGCWATAVSDESTHYSINEPPSKLILVPKTLKAPRLIASEPISHQWCQQAVKDYLTERTSSTWISSFISFRDQVPNQVLARQGSIDGSLATIDLSEASDRLSLWLIERIFRRNRSLLDALHAVRTRSISNATELVNSGSSKLLKFACMGSACTFPVQTLVFLIISLGVSLHQEGLEPTITNIKSLKGRVRTFGDDIIVPTSAADRVMDTLAYLGLKVNHFKTFRNGKFRESCGLDVYDGTDVTPTYSMTYPSSPKPESIASVVETHNNFLRRGWYCASDYIASTVRSVCRTIRNVPLDSGDFGLATVGYVDNDHLKKRYNPHLQRAEVFCTLVSTKSKKIRDEVDRMLLQYFTEAPDPDDIWVGGVASIPSLSLKKRWVDASIRSRVIPGSSGRGSFA